MDKKEREASTEPSSAGPTTSTETLALRNFTIPRKKRESGQALLESCPKESWDYSLIQSKLREYRLDMRKEYVNAWLWKDINLVHNEEFLKEFSEKRAEMRLKGRHGREMEERFCFLVASHEATTQVYQLGLRTEKQDQYSLGKPSHGVYLYKHVDVALKHAASSECNGRHLIIFKVLFGKVKKVTPSLDWSKTPDPMVAFDCHISKDAVSHRDSLSQQLLGSSVFLFDYNENQELNKRPRQCLPYAVVSFDLAISAIPPKSLSPPVSPSKPPADIMHGHPEHFRGYTVAERRGKGENATVTFKHFKMQSLDYKPKPSGEDTSPIQQNELQKPFSFTHQQIYMPLFHTAESFELKLPYSDNVSMQSDLGISFPSNVEHLSPTNTYRGNTDINGVTPKTSAEKISTIVYSSRLVKDPRLTRQEKNTQDQSSDQEKGVCVSACNEQMLSQNQEEKTETTRAAYCEKQSVGMDEEQRDVFLKFSVDDPHTQNLNPQPKPESLPSIKLFKMKFKKYAAYFKMTEKERHKNIMSQENLTKEQKQLLINRINFYEIHYQRYIQGLMFKKDTGTEKVFDSSHEKPQNNQLCLSTQEKTPLTTKENTCKMHQSNVRHSVRSNVSNYTSMVDLVDAERYEVDGFTANNDEITNKSTESTANTIQEKKHDCSSDRPEFYVGHQDGSVLQPVGEVGILEQSFEQGPSQSDTSEKNEVIENKLDCEKAHWYSKQDQANYQAVREVETSTCTRETFLSETTLSSNKEENHEPELHNITAVDGENCACKSGLNVSENNGLSFISAVRQDQQSQISPEKQNRKFKTHSKPDDIRSSEMSILIKIVGSLDNTIHNALYERLKLDQLLPILNGANIASSKSYLIPKYMDKASVNYQQYNDFNEITPNESYSKADIRNWQCEDDPQFGVMRKYKTGTTERLSLSERFCKKPLAIVHDKKFTNSYTSAPAEDVKSHLAALIPSDKGDGPLNNNEKLIQLLAQRYNARRSKFRCLRQKCSKVLGNKKSNSRVSLPLKCSAQPMSHVLRTARHIRKIHLQKPKKIYKTKLASNKSSHYRALVRKSRLDLYNLPSCTTEKLNTDNKDYDSWLNLGALAQSSDPPRHHCNDESSQTDDTINTSSEDHPCLNTSQQSEIMQSHDEGFMHVSLSKEQWTHSPNQAANIVCDDVSRILRNNDINKSLEEITLGPVMTYEIEPEKRTNNIMCHQELSSSITCCGISESYNPDGEDLKEEHKLSSVTPNQPRKEECDVRHISTDFNTGACKAQGRPARAVFSIPVGKNSSDKISSYTEKNKTTKTPDLSRILIDDNTDAEARLLPDSVVDTTNAASGITTSLVDIMVNVSKTGEMEANVCIQNSDLHNDEMGTDANDKVLSSDVTTNAEQSSFKSLKGAKDDAAKILTGALISPHGNMNHPSEPASISQCQPASSSQCQPASSSQYLPASSSQCQSAAKHTKSTGAVNSQVVTTADLNSKVITDAKDVTVIKGDLHSVWQDNNRIPNMSETQLIAKLRDYLTKFEFSVKRQETVNDSEKESTVPMAWITLDSTVHKQQLLDIKHYNRPGLTNIRHGKDNLDVLQSSAKMEKVTQKAKVLTKTINNQVTTIKSNRSKGRSRSKSCISNRRRRSKDVMVSPQSTSTQKHSHSHLVNENTGELQTSTKLPNTRQHTMQNHAIKVQKNLIICSQDRGDLKGPSRVNQVNQSDAEKAKKVNEQTLYNEKVNKTNVQREFSVTDISSILKLADHALSLSELVSLQLKCKGMLLHFISNFERDQHVSFNQSCVSKNLILEKYLNHPPAIVELTFEALNSLLELQMMMEAWLFVENKINFLRRKPTFRSLLWYDPTLYGELYKGPLGFQHQSSLFSTFQQCLSVEGYGKLQEYYLAVSTLHQQLQDAPDTSYYMYLKSKRERLETEAALRNPPDVSSFFLSVPIALMINFGDSLESLEKAYRVVMTFVETPSDHLPGIFDMGKAEHLSILCRYLQEKTTFLKSCEHISKVTWFGLEHLLYDASKVLLWRESEHEMPKDVLTKYKESNPQIVYGVTEAGVALVNKMDQHPQFIERFQLTPKQLMDDLRKYRNTHSGMSTEKNYRLNIRPDGGNNEIRRPNKRRATHPPLRCDDGGVTPLTQTNLSAQHGNQTPYLAFPHWSLPENNALDWNPPSVHQASASHSEIRALLLARRRTVPSTELRTSPVMSNQRTHVLRQWPPPMTMNPMTVEQMNYPPMRDAPHLAEFPKEPRNESTVPMIQPCSVLSFPLDAASTEPPGLTTRPITDTLNQVPLHSKATPINYPYFVFNGQTYSTVGSSSVSTSVQDGDMEHHPHPV